MTVLKPMLKLALFPLLLLLAALLAPFPAAEGAEREAPPAAGASAPAGEKRLV